MFEEDFLADLSLDDVDRKREECDQCYRPATACWCRHVSSPRVETETRVLVLQHPGEVKRNIRTCRMLELGLAENCVQVINQSIK